MMYPTHATIAHSCCLRDGRAAELRRVSLISDVWTGSSSWFATGVYRAGYQIALDDAWRFTSGGIYIPTGSGETYSAMTPLGGGAAEPVADVWIAPGHLPGS